MWRRIGGFIAGLVIAVGVVQIAELGVHAMNPPPPGTNLHDMAAVKAYVAKLPASAMILVLFGWLIGTVAGTFVAARIARTPAAAYILGALLFCGGVFNSFVIPQPLWFSIASLVIYVIGTIAGARLGAAPRPALASARPQPSSGSA